MPKVISTQEFLNLSKTIPIIDVRSPGEYDHAHIPGALSLPLFSNEERAEVGTIYKQRGRVKAVQRGLEIVGPKMSQFSKSALSLNSQQVLVHCWRGG
ncbi:MAG TPA: tRNA 2-selenouridine(34) synthase MnmH, partial [Rikenellaceae bacterium]|nr:tRNA 2-selenouridine(34) synthase MnmH [Rikenellaceae bacterium]